MASTQAVTTPQPFRQSKPGKETHQRMAFESEVWDDLIAQIFSFNDSTNRAVNQGATLDYTYTVKCPVACRLEWEYLAIVSVTVGATAFDVNLRGLLDGVLTDQSGADPAANIHRVPAALWRDTVTGWAVQDVKAGVHTIGFRVTNASAAGGPNCTVERAYSKARRGRKPPG